MQAQQILEFLSHKKARGVYLHLYSACLALHEDMSWMLQGHLLNIKNSLKKGPRTHICTVYLKRKTASMLE